MKIETLLEALDTKPEAIEFNDVITCIDKNYDYTPKPFRNGTVENAAGCNEGSCKIFGFAMKHGLPTEKTLALFGQFYREDVLRNPEASNHQNIRQFMIRGWQGLEFPEGNPLSIAEER